MVILQQETEPKLKTPAQEKLMYQLLQSKVFSKKEFESFHQKVLKSVVSSYDASVVLSYLLAKTRFHKRFFSVRCRAHARCDRCRATENLRRCYAPDLKSQIFYCNACEQEITEEISHLAAEKKAVDVPVETQYGAEFSQQHSESDENE